jgi:hypothetical protein
MNIAAAGFQPVEVMRFVLGSLFGLDKLYAKSERWVRAVMMQGAPTAAEIAAGCDEDWFYPPRPAW